MIFCYLTKKHYPYFFLISKFFYQKFLGWRAAYIFRGAIGIVFALGVALFVKDPRERGYTNSPTNSSLGKTQTNAGVAKGDLEMGGGGGTWAELKKALQGCGEVMRSPAVRIYTHTHTHTHTNVYI